MPITKIRICCECRKIVGVETPEDAARQNPKCALCAAQETIRVWCVDWDEEPDEPNAASLNGDMEEVAERHVEDSWDGDGAPNVRVNVRDETGTLHLFEVVVEYEPTFSASRMES